MSDDGWRRCSACKEPIALGATYWACSVSTCNRVRTALFFCSVSCWEVHLPGARHRESWAVEKQAPRTAEAATVGPPGQRTGRRRIVRSDAPREASVAPLEVLVVASRLKDYVRAQSGMNTSDGVLAPLSDILRKVVDETIRNASREGRKTLLDRDVPKP